MEKLENNKEAALIENDHLFDLINSVRDPRKQSEIGGDNDRLIFESQ
jgi:hypothetical protein